MVSKLNIKVIEIKSNIRQEFESLGKMVYENFGDDESANKAEVAAQVQSIKDLYSELSKLKTQIAFMKNKILCKSCGNHNEIGSLYCSKCGENLKSEGTPIVDAKDEEDDFSEFED